MTKLEAWTRFCGGVGGGGAVKELFVLGLLNLVQWALEKLAWMAQVVMVAEKQVWMVQGGSVQSLLDCVDWISLRQLHGEYIIVLDSAL